MPLTPSDIAYLNKLLDRHLKHQKSWPSVRHVMLATGGLLIIIGIWSEIFSFSMMRQMLQIPVPASRPASTEPVTYDALRMTQEMLKMQAHTDAYLFSIGLSFEFVGILFFFIGINIAGLTLSKWNHHRRDTLLITLLREKCAPELAPPPTPLKPEI
jgi:hypothetical protein